VRYVFEQWSDGGAQSHTVVTPGTVFYTAYFRTEYAVVATVEPPGSGTVQLIPSGGWYEQGRSVLLRALPDTSRGYAFARWSGDLTTDDNPITLTVDGPKSVTAHFAPLDLAPPVLLYAHPPDRAVYVPTNTAIELAIADGPVGSGINLSSVAIAVNGNAIANGGTILPGHQATLRLRSGGVSFRYQPATPFVPKAEIEVRVRATDLATTPNVLDTTFRFAVAPYPVLVTATQEVGPDGGFVTDPLTRLQITIPAAALADTAVLTIAQAPSPPPLPDSLSAAGVTYHLGPDGMSFTDSVTVAMPYTEADLVATGARDPSALPIFRFDTRRGTWERLYVTGVYRNFVFVRMANFCYLLFCRNKGSTVAEPQSALLPKVFSFSLGFPNPSNGCINFALDLPRPARVRLCFYDLCGRLVRSIDQGLLPAGSYRLQWDARDDQGAEVPTGIYLCCLEAQQLGTPGSSSMVARHKVALVK